MVDPAVYPYFDIYPAVNGRGSPQLPREEQRSVALSASGIMNLVPISVRFGTAYPRLDICKSISPVLPFRLIELKLTMILPPLFMV